MANLEIKDLVANRAKRPWYLNRWLLGAVAAVAVYTGAGFLLAPYLVRHYVPKIAAEQLKRQASVGEVRVNPYLLTLEARDFAFQEAGGEPILGFQRLFVDLEVESLFRWAWTFADIRIEGPSVNLVVGKDDRLNLARIADDLPKAEAPQEPRENEPPPRLLLKHAALAGGVVKFTDLSNPTPASATVEPLDLELNDISTLPERRGPYGISATLPGGGAVAWQGEVSLNPIASSGTVRIDGFRPATPWKFFQDRLRLAEPGGELDADASYRFAYASGRITLSADPIKIAVRDLALTEEGVSSPMLELASIEIPDARFDLGSRELIVPTLAIRDGRVDAAVDAGGNLNWAILTRTAAATEPPQTQAAPVAATPEQPWKLRVDALTVDGVALNFADASRATPITFAAGSSQLSLGATVETGGAGLKLVTDNIDIALRRVDLKETAGAQMLGVESITLQGGRFDLGSREFVAPKVAIRDGRLAAAVDAEGTVNWTMPPKNPETAVPAEPEAGSGAVAQPWKLQLESFTVDDIALDYTDASRAIPITITAGSSQLSLGATAEIGGPETKLLTDNIELALRRVAWTETAGAPLLGVESITLQGGKLDLAERTVLLQRVAVEQGSAQLTRSADGTVRQVTALFPSEEGKALRELRAAGEAAQAEGRPWGFALEQLELSRFALGYADEIAAPAIQYDLEDLNVIVKDLRNDGKTPITYEAGFKVRQGGSARVAGTASQAGDAAEARVKLERLALSPLAPLVSKFTALTLQSGDLSGTTRIKYRTAERGPSLQASGTLSAGDLLLNEAETGERFLAWKALSADGVDFSLGPDRLAIKELRLLEPGAKIVIFEDKSVNLAKVLKTDQRADSEAPQGKSAASPFPLSVERIRVEKGVVDFADLSLVLPFATQIQDFGGAATGVSSDPKSRTSLKFEGQVGEFGQANVDGSLAPFDPKGFTDITVAFRNVAMTPLSPYSATFAGRKIASGKLNLDLQYKVENSEMLGDNKVVLRQFTLGEKVESPDAMDLPLDLAIALLTDSEGKIDVAVPVRGNIDSPEFSYGQVIGQAIGKMITKIVTAPFRALGAAFGGGDESMDAVLFEPGQAELAPPEKEKLKNLAEALAKRPQLKLTAHGAFDPAIDGVAIKDRNLRLALAEQLDVQLAPGEDPGPVDYDSAKTQRALEKIAAERGGEKAVDEFQAAFEKSAGRKAKRVNPALALLGQASEDRDFYRALFDQLVETAPKPEAELQALGEQRAAAMVQALTTAGGLDASRVAAGRPEPAQAKDKTVPAKLELGVHKSGA